MIGTNEESLVRRGKKSGVARLEDLQKLVRTLRGPGGCPWDRAQKISDIKQYLLEECYEVLDAIDHSPPQKLKEELGDLLFQIVFIAQMAEEKGDFGLEDVLGEIHTKMVRRHPHVFGSASAEDPEAVRRNWWKMKQTEGATPRSQLEGVPRHLPALQRAYRLGQRASQAGLDWPDPPSVLEKVKEEIDELEGALASEAVSRIREELGDSLFSLANLARLLKENPEEILQQSNEKFLNRFQRLEQRALAEGKALEELPTEELDRLWEEIKGTDS
jgi:tetrapyrrole methylase family protein/MazG family protein/ATP diphosphatase